MYEFNESHTDEQLQQAPRQDQMQQALSQEYRSAPQVSPVIQPRPQPIYPQLPPMYGPRPEDKTTTNIILAIVQFFFFCRTTGVIVFILSLIGNDSYKQQNFADYEEKLKAINITLIIGWVVGALKFVFIILYFVFLILLGVN